MAKGKKAQAEAPEAAEEQEQEQAPRASKQPPAAKEKPSPKSKAKDAEDGEGDLLKALQERVEIQAEQLKEQALAIEAVKAQVNEVEGDLGRCVGIIAAQYGEPFKTKLVNVILHHTGKTPEQVLSEKRAKDIADGALAKVPGGKA